LLGSWDMEDKQCDRVVFGVFFCGLGSF
jgi:hypothetical protein